ncbi:MAG TPA: radical SAM protein [Methanocorpusculum sp.]|nr:radical SAM protein [Methanocorpusculum sp.]
MHYIQAKSLLSAKNGINIYRGCTHGCIYCDSRSTVYQMDHVFEDVAVKENAAELLDAALSRKKKRCMIGFGSMSDPYIPLERELKLTRRCLEIISARRFGVSLITKSDLLLRDLDILSEIHEKAKTVVSVTLTTADDSLCRKIEPHAPPVSRRAEMLSALHDAGIPAIVWLCPILPWINDTEENLLQLLEICKSTRVCGVICFGFGLTLREENREHFYQQLDREFPGLSEKYRQVFGSSYGCASPDSDRLLGILRGFCKKEGISSDTQKLFTFMNTLGEEDTGLQTTLL